MKQIKLNMWGNISRYTNLEAGMTYVELIVVLSIFSVLATIAIYNYGSFEGKVSIVNLANDIALKVVQGQKDASYGKLPPLAQQAMISPSWNPSYGVNFDLTADNKSFTYFSDLNGNNFYDPGAHGCQSVSECLENITLTNGNTISGIKMYRQDGIIAILTGVNLSFTRPNLLMIARTLTGLPYSSVARIEITITSPKGNSAIIKIFASGRVQVNGVTTSTSK